METWSWLELYSSGAVRESSQQESIVSGHSHPASAAAIEELHGQCGVGMFESVLSEAPVSVQNQRQSWTNAFAMLCSVSHVNICSTLDDRIEKN